MYLSLFQDRNCSSSSPLHHHSLRHDVTSDNHTKYSTRQSSKPEPHQLQRNTCNHSQHHCALPTCGLLRQTDKQADTLRLRLSQVLSSKLSRCDLVFNVRLHSHNQYHQQQQQRQYQHQRCSVVRSHGHQLKMRNTKKSRTTPKLHDVRHPGQH